ncbi:MAG: hypothetical protein K9J83_03780 [Desulfarculaceae bacterium]|nr:hypothetical protein [Desulfarculaceae bacterium]
MKIVNSHTALSAGGMLEKRVETEKKLNVWRDSPARIRQRRAAAAAEQAPSPARSKSVKGTIEEDPPLDPKTEAIKRILEALTGKKIEIADPGKFQTRQTAPEESPAEAGRSSTPERKGWGLEYTETVTSTEKEENLFTGTGTVETAAGETIDFSLALEMKREFVSKSGFTLKAGDALIDPLVVNFSGKAADLSDTRFTFDLNADGTEESINRLDPASGFLVFDKNGNGRADNGSELFGPATGNGFDELSRLDKDGNGWIDESDPDYTRLFVWSGNDSETAEFAPLKEKAIGALSLDNVDTEFSVKDSNNHLLGRIRRTGIYLSENQSAGTVQQIDLTA